MSARTHWIKTKASNNYHIVHPRLSAWPAAGNAVLSLCGYLLNTNQPIKRAESDNGRNPEESKREWGSAPWVHTYWAVCENCVNLWEAEYR